VKLAAFKKRWRVGWLEICLTVSFIALILQLWPDMARAWREWPHPGQQTPARAQLNVAGGYSTDVQYLIYLPREYSSRQRWPLLLFLHGSGSRGDDLNLVLKGDPATRAVCSKGLPMLVVSPQCRAQTTWDSQPLLDHLQERFAIDPDRIYVGGYSMGGFGTWDVATIAPKRFAAIVPVAGGGDASQATRLVKLPVWAFHGAEDRTVPIEGNRQMIEAIQAAGGDARLTVYEDRGHDTCGLTFNRDDVYTWLLQHNRAK
jgi:predicted peptidase